MTTLRQIFKIINIRPRDILYTSKDFSVHTDYRFVTIYFFGGKKMNLDRFCKRIVIFEGKKNLTSIFFAEKIKNHKN